MIHKSLHLNTKVLKKNIGMQYRLIKSLECFINQPKAYFFDVPNINL